jgi:hypothetical protein
MAEERESGFGATHTAEVSPAVMRFVLMQTFVKRACSVLRRATFSYTALANA